jgi:hypothetical protein
MKRVFIALIILWPLFSNTQAGTKTRKGDIKEKLFSSDSVQKKIQQIKDDVARAADSQQVTINVENNVNQLLEIQKENKDRQRRASITRLAIGAAFLALLVIGLMKRRKKKG